MDIIMFTQARNNLKAVLDKVVADSMPTVIFRQRGESVVIMAKSDYDRMAETDYLLTSPANARRLREAMTQMDAGQGEERDLIEPCRAPSIRQPGKITVIGLKPIGRFCPRSTI